MPPGWVKDLDDYLLWLNRLIQDSGGWLEPGATLDVTPIVAGDDSLLGMEVERQTIHFGGGSRLNFDLSIDVSLEVNEYHFRYFAADGQVQWRLDKHTGHEDRVGGLCHIHYGGGGRADAFWYQEVDLEDVLLRVHDALIQE